MPAAMRATSRRRFRGSVGAGLMPSRCAPAPRPWSERAEAWPLPPPSRAARRASANRTVPSVVARKFSNCSSVSSAAGVVGVVVGPPVRSARPRSGRTPAPGSGRAARPARAATAGWGALALLDRLRLGHGGFGTGVQLASRIRSARWCRRRGSLVDRMHRVPASIRSSLAAASARRLSGWAGVVGDVFEVADLLQRRVRRTAGNHRRRLLPRIPAAR